MSSLFKPLWLILSGDNEVAIAGTRIEAVSEAQRLFRDSFTIMLFLKVS